MRDKRGIIRKIPERASRPVVATSAKDDRPGVPVPILIGKLPNIADKISDTKDTVGLR